MKDAKYGQGVSLNLKYSEVAMPASLVRKSTVLIDRSSCDDSTSSEILVESVQSGEKGTNVSIRVIATILLDVPHSDGS